MTILAKSIVANRPNLTKFKKANREMSKLAWKKQNVRYESQQKDIFSRITADNQLV